MTEKVPQMLICLGFLPFALVATSHLDAQSKATDSATMLSVAEAAVLVYISPVGDTDRARGSDVGMERQLSTKFNQRDYYVFWVYDAKAPSSGGSVTLGYYAVNKHTGDVWDAEEDPRTSALSSAVLQGVQRILRIAHRISENTMRAYGGQPVWRAK